MNEYLDNRFDLEELKKGIQALDNGSFSKLVFEYLPSLGQFTYHPEFNEIENIIKYNEFVNAVQNSEYGEFFMS